VLRDVARQRHRQVEVQPELGRLVLGRLEPAQGVDLLVGLPLGQELLDRLDRARLDRGEAEQLELAPDRVEQAQLDHPLLGQPLGKSTDGAGLGHA
jgi:hypothetical protein